MSDDFDLPRRLASRLRDPLPGRAAQARCEPALSYGRHFDRPPEEARRAAVMILIYPHEGRWHLPLVMRPSGMTHHAGQIGLPGGVIDSGEEPQAAALRELEEELGVAPDQVELLGGLSPLYLFVSNYYALSWLGWTRERPIFRPSPAEVAEIIELPLADLAHANVRRRRWTERGLTFTTPEWVVGEHVIWGATAMLLSELAAVLEEALPT